MLSDNSVVNERRLVCFFCIYFVFCFLKGFAQEKNVDFRSKTVYRPGFYTVRLSINIIRVYDKNKNQSGNLNNSNYIQLIYTFIHPFHGQRYIFETKRLLSYRKHYIRLLIKIFQLFFSRAIIFNAGT